MTTNKPNILILTLLCIVLFIENSCVWMGQGDAALFLEDLAVGDKQSRLESRTPAPTLESIEYDISGDRYQADLYHPGEQALAGIVLIPGAARDGKDDSRLIAFATTLARFRFMVLVPDIPNLRELKVQAEDSRTIREAFTYLISRPDFPTNRQAGIGAFSYAVGPAILTALEPEVREKVGFILSVGGYYDIEQVITFFTTGFFRDNNAWQYLEPNVYGKWIFVLNNVEYLTDSVDKERFIKIAEQKMKNPDFAVDDLTTNLTKEARSILKLLQNQNPEHAPYLLTKLPSTIRAELDALDLSNKDLAKLKARLILLHGTDDNIIPYTESVALVNAVMEDQAELFLIDGLAHVDVRPKKLDRWAMLRAIDALLNVRELKSEKS